MTTPNLKLISFKLCPYVQRARIVLNEKGIPHEIEFIDLANKPDWFLELSPLGKVPLLLVDGEPVFESNVIAEYLDEISTGSLLPADSLAKARSRAWIEFASATLNAVSTFYRANSAAALDEAATVLRDRFRNVENALGEGPWFNGESFSLVDAAFAPLFRYFDLFELYGEFDFFAETPKIRAWRKLLRARPSVQNAIVDDYYERLEQFIIDLDSELSRRILGRHAA